LFSSVSFTVANSSAEFLVKQFSQHNINVVSSYREFAVIDFDEKQVEWAIRVSPHYYNTVDELDALVDCLAVF
jgi:selenocysteine lyase/cysteine desulfurase